ncbi:MAG: hypothetical protein KDJ80_13365 [Nitratireductor sp.]|nr:hypothetical protein [Nitratireductor sp.]
MGLVRSLGALVLSLALLAGLALPSSAQQSRRVTFVAQLVPDSIPVEDGLEWRIFGPTIGEDGSLPLLANATGGSRSFDMPPGEYLVHCAYGHASAIRKIEVTAESTEEFFILNAGGMQLEAVAGDDTPIPENLLRFDIYEDQADERGERRLIASRVLPGRIVPFQEGTYHVVSQFGNLNAEVRADIRVTAGKLTHAELKHRAARITLRLVRSAGGDALADTKWSVLNASGDLITESTSAFPRMVLSEGVYTAIAKNGDRIYSQDFEVRPGINEDIEVLAGA